MKDFKQKIAEVKLAYNIVDYIEQSGVSLKRNGTNKWKGLCFVHSEKTPSFVVDEQFQNYRCFGCGANGDIIKFVQVSENLEFIEAVKQLAEAKGIEFDLEDNDGPKIDYKSLRECMKDVSNFYYKQFVNLPDDHVAKEQILDRGLSLKGKVLYGYAPEGGSKVYDFLRSKGYSDEIILDTGVCKKSSRTGKIFDFWQGRLMFFITDSTGRPVGFSGRKLFETDTMGKYVNSSDGPLFNKSSVLFNQANARKMAGESEEIYVAEGQFDVAAISESGLFNVVASSGTAFTEKQGSMCSRMVGPDGKIIFAFDGDKAGVAAAVKVFEHSPVIQSQSYVVSFPDGQDPCDFRKKNGSEKLEEHLREHRIPLVEFVLKSMSDGEDLSDPQSKASYLEKSASVLKSIDKLSLRNHYMRMVAIETFSEIQTVEKLVEKADSIYRTLERVDSEKSDEPVEENSGRYEQNETEERIIETLDDDFGSYYIAHRLLSFIMSEQRFRSEIDGLITNVPKGLRRTFMELSRLEGESTLPELFTYSSYVEILLGRNYFPYIRLMTDDDKDQLFLNLKNELNHYDNTLKVSKVRGKISKVLSSKNSSSQLLAKALQKEESYFREEPVEGKN